MNALSLEMPIGQPRLRQWYCIPNLQLNLSLVVNSDGFGGKLDTNSDVVLIGKLAFDVLGQHGCLANT
jgi:hypothetical protein